MASAQTLRIALAALLLFGAALPAQALQLGDTKAHILARHGEPGAEDQAHKSATYSWEGWSAQLTYREGLVQELAYRKTVPLQESEIASLLQSNGGRNRWRETPAAGKGRTWERDDGAFAEYVDEHPTSIVFSATRPPAHEAAPAPSATPTAPTATPAVAPKPTPAPTPAPTIATSVPAPARVPVPEILKPEPPRERVELVAETKPPPRPRRLIAAEEPEPDVPAPIAATGAEPIELKPIASREPAFHVSATPAAKSAEILTTAVTAPANGPPHQSRGGFGLIAIFVVLAGLIAGLVLLLKNRLLDAPSDGAQDGIRRLFPEPSSNAPRGAVAFPALDALRWDQFELLVAETFRREDYIVEISAGIDADGGIDLTLRRDSESFLVQCKHWKAARVAERELREFYGTMAATGAPQGIVITLGTFSRDAQTFAAEKGIELLDRAALEQRMEAVSRPGENLCEVADWIDEFAAHARVFDPECPVCNGSMVIRQSRTGGAAAWGCRSYPRCPGKREPRRDLLAVPAGR